DAPGQVGHGTLGVAGRGEGVGGARPEGADVPQDADGAARGGVLVRASPPGDEEQEAEADEPGAEGLGGLCRSPHEGGRAVGGAGGGAAGGEGPDEGGGAEEEGADGGDGDDE